MAWMLTVDQWLGTRVRAQSYEFASVKTTIIGMISRLPLAETIRALKHHERGYNTYFSMTVVNFRVLSATLLPEDALDDDWRALGVEIIDAEFATRYDGRTYLDHPYHDG